MLRSAGRALKRRTDNKVPGAGRLFPSFFSDPGPEVSGCYCTRIRLFPNDFIMLLRVRDAILLTAAIMARAGLTSRATHSAQQSLDTILGELTANDRGPHAMRCPSCNADNPDGAKFCSSCGTGLPINCPSCGALNRPGSRFFKDCRAALSPRLAPAPVDKPLAIAVGTSVESGFVPEGERK